MPQQAGAAVTYRRWRKLTIAKALLVATGVWWGLCMQLIFYGGAGHPLAQLPNVDWYLGMMLVYSYRLFTSRDARFARVHQRDMLPIALCDFIGTVGTTVGLEYAGSAIFGIIFASVTVWSAMFTCLILKKRQTRKQTLGILAVVAGLALPALEVSDADPADELEVHIGIALTCVGTLFYSLEYVLCERVFTLHDKPSDAKEVCFWTGAWGLSFTCVWLAFVTVPRWRELVTDEVAAAGGSPALLAFLYVTHCLNNSVHNVAWFTVCELESGVSTGLLMGLKAASLFFASAAFFCSSDHPEQCMTLLKFLSTVVVLVGTAVYYGLRLPRWPVCCSPSKRSHRGMRRLTPDMEASELGELAGEPVIGPAEEAGGAGAVDPALDMAPEVHEVRERSSTRPPKMESVEPLDDEPLPPERVASSAPVVVRTRERALSRTPLVAGSRSTGWEEEIVE